ncbi:MAG: metallophosphoesterase [Chloroflexaceae bacterium]|nr:metallophosphoesterase [Chloroflexaceae bacterium]
MRLLFAADLHGYYAAYENLLNLAVTHEVQAIIVGGDLLPHTIRIDSAVESQRAFLNESLRPLLASFHQAHPDKAVYLLPGNDDWAAAIAGLDELERMGLAYRLHQRTVALADNLWLTGYACVPITPFSIKDYERYDGIGDVPAYSFAMAYTSTSGQPQRTSLAALLRQSSIADDLQRLVTQSDPARTIYICHTPPYDTDLDLNQRKRHRGSQALRRFIEQHQPLLTMHGHIHESPDVSQSYAQRIGATWSINAGQNDHRSHAVVLDTADIGATLWHTVYGKRLSP